MPDAAINSKKPKKKSYFIMLIISVLMICAALAMTVTGAVRILLVPGGYALSGTEVFTRALTADEEGYDEDSKKCSVEYVDASGVTLTVEYTFEQWEELPDGHQLKGYVYSSPDGPSVAFDREANEKEISAAVRDRNADANAPLFSVAMAIGFAGAGFLVMSKWGAFFTLYEKSWFISILVLASVFSLIFPEDSMNGVNGLWIMLLYLLDTFLNILCELLISKQSKWNFIVSVFVELTEITISVVLAYRFATLASTLLFWLPIDIVSFINWHRHPDRHKEELTKVRKLSGWAEAAIIAGIVVWTAGIGYLLTRIDIGTDLFGGNEVLETVVCYLDACVSAVAICNGVFILLRIREQWIAWFIDAILEGVINVLSGQYVLLVLKLGYLTNSTYGYIKWTKYIRENKEEVAADKHFF